jgi:hypothetical protein
MTDRLVAKLLADPLCWTQGVMARDRWGDEVPPCHSSAVRWCILGAVEKCYSDFADAEAARSALARRLSGQGMSVGFFNDSHTHAEVLALVRSAGC